MSEPETFEQRLDKIRADLASIVERMNRDNSENVAMKAQIALMAVSDLANEASSHMELDWNWQPSDEPG